jgi:hypothetical protein
MEGEDNEAVELLCSVTCLLFILALTAIPLADGFYSLESSGTLNTRWA